VERECRQISPHIEFVPLSVVHSVRHYHSFPMLDEGFWAEIKVGGEHLRLFSERNALGVQASVYNVNTKSWIALPNWSMTSSRAKKRPQPTQRHT